MKLKRKHKSFMEAFEKRTEGEKKKPFYQKKRFLVPAVLGGSYLGASLAGAPIPGAKAVRKFFGKDPHIMQDAADRYRDYESSGFLKGGSVNAHFTAGFEKKAYSNLTNTLIGVGLGGLTGLSLAHGMIPTQARMEGIPSIGAAAGAGFGGLMGALRNWGEQKRRDQALANIKAAPTKERKEQLIRSELMGRRAEPYGMIGSALGSVGGLLYLGNAHKAGELGAQRLKYSGMIPQIGSIGGLVAGQGLGRLVHLNDELDTKELKETVD